MGKIQIDLLNGTQLVCKTERTGVVRIVSERIILDKIGKYLSVGRKKPLASRSHWDTYFTNHAFYFLERADEIFSDSRMFFAPVYVENGLAYSGTSGFEHPTLGIYIEWWLNCETDVMHDHDGNEALTFLMSGSPLSGMNSYLCVYPDGIVRRIDHCEFRKVWRSFWNINGRYSDAKQLCKAYSLETVFAVLEARRKRHKFFGWLSKLFDLN